MTNQQHRQAQLDKIAELAAAETTCEGLGYLAATLKELQQVGDLDIDAAKEAVLNKAVELRQATIDARDLLILEKHIIALSEEAPSAPTISFSRTQLAQRTSGILTISDSFSETYGENLTYELRLTNLSAEKTFGLRAGEVEITALDVETETTGTIKVRAISPSGVFGDWSTITLTVRPAPYAGFIENINTNKSKRIGTGSSEDNAWLDKAAPRINEETNDDEVTLFFDESMPQGQMKRVVIDSVGNITDFVAKSWNHTQAATLQNSATAQIYVKIPTHYIIDMEFTHNEEIYLLKLVSLAPFSFDLNAFGYAGYTELAGRGIEEREGLLKSIEVEEFYMGATEATKEGDIYGCFLRQNTKAERGPGRAAFRVGTEAFGPGFKIQSFMERTHVAHLYYTERGYFGNTGELRLTTSKWADYAWSPQPQNASQWTELAAPLLSTISLGNKTGSVRNSDQKPTAHSYRGLENLSGDFYEFADGVFVVNLRVWLAETHEQSYNDNTDNNCGYTDTGYTLPSAGGGGAWVKRMWPGTLIAREVGNGASATTGVTDLVYTANASATTYYCPSVSANLSQGSSAGLAFVGWRFSFTGGGADTTTRPCFKPAP